MTSILKKTEIPYRELDEIDRWALHQLQKLISRVREAYDRFEFHIGLPQRPEFLCR